LESGRSVAELRSPGALRQTKKLRSSGIKQLAVGVELVRERGLRNEEQLRKILHPDVLTQPTQLRKRPHAWVSDGTRTPGW
jgi:hypothetical protein